MSYTIVAHASHVPLHPKGWRMVNVGKDQFALRGSTNRRLSWRECATIQELPSSIQVPGGLIAKYPRRWVQLCRHRSPKSIIVPGIKYHRRKKLRSSKNRSTKLCESFGHVVLFSTQSHMRAEHDS